MLITPIVKPDGEVGPRGNYRKTARTRQRILDAALDVFGELGFDGGSIREVAERAGISQAGLLHHYPSKVALLSAVLERRDERAAARTMAQPSGAHRLWSAVEFARDSAQTPWEIAVFAVLSAEATRPEHPANEYMRRRYSWTTEVFTQAFTDAQQVGHLHDWVDPSEAASQFIALWDGLQIQWLLEVGDVDVADRLEKFLNFHLVRPLRTLITETPSPPPGPEAAKQRRSAGAQP